MERNTLQKKIVFDVFKKLNHPTAIEVYDNVHKEYPNISRSTVYRTLNQWVEDGSVQKIRILNGADIFDVTVKKHYHVRCLGCGSVRDVELTEEPIFNATCLENEFDIINCEIIFEGYCKDCKTKIKKEGN